MILFGLRVDEDTYRDVDNLAPCLQWYRKLLCLIRNTDFYLDLLKIQTVPGRDKWKFTQLPGRVTRTRSKSGTNFLVLIWFLVSVFTENVKKRCLTVFILY